MTRGYNPHTVYSGLALVGFDATIHSQYVSVCVCVCVCVLEDMIMSLSPQCTRRWASCCCCYLHLCNDWENIMMMPSSSVLLLAVVYTCQPLAAFRDVRRYVIVSRYVYVRSATLTYKKLSYSRETARRPMLVNSCYVSRGMGVEKVSDNESDLQGHSRALAMVPFDRPQTIFY